MAMEETPGTISMEPPRGIKRKVDEMTGPRPIRALHQDVVNKIAAGEIIVAPVHALKELIENAVDAGSTALEIIVKDGGLKVPMQAYPDPPHRLESRSSLTF